MDTYVKLQDVLDICMKYCPDDDGTCSKAGSDLREMLDELENLESDETSIIINNISEQIRNKNVHPERKYVAISVKHSEHGWRFGKPLTLWGYHRTADDEERCFGGYTDVLSKADLYAIDDMSGHGYDGTICKKEPVHMSYDFCKKWQRYDTVLMEESEYGAYCLMCGIAI